MNKIDRSSFEISVYPNDTIKNNMEVRNLHPMSLSYYPPKQKLNSVQL